MPSTGRFAYALVTCIDHRFAAHVLYTFDGMTTAAAVVIITSVRLNRSWTQQLITQYLSRSVSFLVAYLQSLFFSRFVIILGVWSLPASVVLVLWWWRCDKNKRSNVCFECGSAYVLRATRDLLHSIEIHFFFKQMPDATRVFLHLFFFLDLINSVTTDTCCLTAQRHINLIESIHGVRGFVCSYYLLLLLWLLL